MSLILNFHGIGGASREFEQGERPYWLEVDAFTKILDVVAQAPSQVMITFDDGNASDVLIAAPELRKRGLKAHFFVLAGKLDQPGYLAAENVAKLDAAPAFIIGSHGMMHRPWPECPDDELEWEVAEAKAILSDICGRPITDAGIPFGRYNRRVLRKLEQLGHTKIYSSDGMPRLTEYGPIPRFSLRNDMPMSKLLRKISQPVPFAKRAENELRALVKRFL